MTKKAGANIKPEQHRRITSIKLSACTWQYICTLYTERGGTTYLQLLWVTFYLRQISGLLDELYYRILTLKMNITVSYTEKSLKHWVLTSLMFMNRLSIAIIFSSLGPFHHELRSFEISILTAVLFVVSFIHCNSNLRRNVLIRWAYYKS